MSKAQLNILKLMNNGWELGFSEGFRSSGYWLQKGGLGRGGETKRGFNRKTMHKLLDLGFINQRKREFPTSHYILTEKGKELLEELK